MQAADPLHLGACRLLCVRIGRTPAATQACVIAAILSADALTHTLADLPVTLANARGGAPGAAISFDISLEPPAHSAPDGIADAECFYPGRVTMRTIVGICDAVVHSEAEIISLSKQFAMEASRLGRTHGPPGGEPAARLFVLNAGEHLMENARIFPPSTRFFLGRPGMEEALQLQLQLELASVSAEVAEALDAELSLFERLGSAAAAAAAVVASPSSAPTDANSTAPLDWGSATTGGVAQNTSNVNIPPAAATPAGLTAMASSASSGIALLTSLIAGGALSAAQLAAAAGPRAGSLDAGLSAGIGGVAAVTGAIRRRFSARLLKHRADIHLALGTAAEALDCADRAVRMLRNTGDALFLGLAHESRAAALVATHAATNALRQRCEVPFLPEVAAALRDAVASFDDAAATVSSGALQQGAGQPPPSTTASVAAHLASDGPAQLTVLSRARLGRYLLSAPPPRALDAMCEAIRVPEGGLMRWALTEGGLQPAAATATSTAEGSCSPAGWGGLPLLIRPDGPGDDSFQRERAFAKAALLRAAVAESGGPEPRASAVSSGSRSGWGGAMLTLDATSERVAALVNASAKAATAAAVSAAAAMSGGAIQLGEATAAEPLNAPLPEFVEVLGAAVARVGAIASASAASRVLLLCADAYEIAGLWRHADGAIARASALLRTQQVAPTLDVAVLDAAGPPPTGLGCVYRTPEVMSAMGGSQRKSAAVVTDSGTLPLGAWPIPWLVNGRDGTRPPPLSSPLPWPRASPALAAATLALGCGSRDHALRARLMGLTPPTVAVEISDPPPTSVDARRQVSSLDGAPQLRSPAARSLWALASSGDDSESRPQSALPSSTASIPQQEQRQSASDPPAVGMVAGTDVPDVPRGAELPIGPSRVIFTQSPSGGSGGDSWWFAVAVSDMFLAGELPSSIAMAAVCASLSLQRHLLRRSPSTVAPIMVRMPRGVAGALHMVPRFICRPPRVSGSRVSSVDERQPPTTPPRRSSAAVSGLSSEASIKRAASQWGSVTSSSEGDSGHPATQPHSLRSPSRVVSSEAIPRLISVYGERPGLDAALLVRRTLLAATALSISLHSPLHVVRALLNGPTIAAHQSPADTAVTLRLLGAMAAETAAVQAHFRIPSGANDVSHSLHNRLVDATSTTDAAVLSKGDDTQGQHEKGSSINPGPPAGSAAVACSAAMSGTTDARRRNNTAGISVLVALSRSLCCCLPCDDAHAICVSECNELSRSLTDHAGPIVLRAGTSFNGGDAGAAFRRQNEVLNAQVPAVTSVAASTTTDPSLWTAPSLLAALASYASWSSYGSTAGTKIGDGIITPLLFERCGGPFHVAAQLPFGFATIRSVTIALHEDSDDADTSGVLARAPISGVPHALFVGSWGAATASSPLYVSALRKPHALKAGDWPGAHTRSGSRWWASSGTRSGGAHDNRTVRSHTAPSVVLKVSNGSSKLATRLVFSISGDLSALTTSSTLAASTSTDIAPAGVVAVSISYSLTGIASRHEDSGELHVIAPMNLGQAAARASDMIFVASPYVELAEDTTAALAEASSIALHVRIDRVCMIVGALARDVPIERFAAGTASTHWDVEIRAASCHDTSHADVPDSRHTTAPKPESQAPWPTASSGSRLDVWGSSWLSK